MRRRERPNSSSSRPCAACRDRSVARRLTAVPADLDQACHYALVGELNWHEIDGDWVVFCHASGALQCVDAVGAALMLCLEDGPASIGELTAQVALAAGASLPEDSMVGVAEYVRRWQHDGWLEPVDA